MTQPTNKPKIQFVKTSDLIPYAKNTRTHSPEQVSQIAGSIREFGFTNPVLVDAENGIIAGHGRVMAAGKLGIEEVPCLRITHLSELQKRAYIIADNRLALDAGWDAEMLKIELSDLKEEDFNIDLIGFTDDELAELFADEPTAGQTDEDEVPEVPETPISVPGDVWVMGSHRVMCGDSLDAAPVEQLMGGAKADLWLTDPPYNVAYTGGTGLTIQNDDMNDTSFRQFLADAYAAADSVMNPGAVFYVWHADSEGFNFRGAAKDVGWTVRQCIIWVKSALVMGRQDYQWKHEPCLYGWKDGAGHHWGSDRKQTTVLEFNKPSRNAEHPTMKPVELFSYQIENSSKIGGVVFDSFGGSGTTVIACEMLGRSSRVMELDPKYCDVIVNRWQDFTGKKATHETTGEHFGAAVK